MLQVRSVKQGHRQGQITQVHLSGWMWDQIIRNKNNSVSWSQLLLIFLASSCNSLGQQGLQNQEDGSISGVLVLSMVKWSTTLTDLTGSSDEADLHLLGCFLSWLSWWGPLPSDSHLGSNLQPFGTCLFTAGQTGSEDPVWQDMAPAIPWFSCKYPQLLTCPGPGIMMAAVVMHRCKKKHNLCGFAIFYISIWPKKLYALVFLSASVNLAVLDNRFEDLWYGVLSSPYLDFISSSATGGKETFCYQCAVT